MRRRPSAAQPFRRRHRSAGASATASAAASLPPLPPLRRIVIQDRLDRSCAAREGHLLRLRVHRHHEAKRAQHRQPVRSAPATARSRGKRLARLLSMPRRRRDLAAEPARPPAPPAPTCAIMKTAAAARGRRRHPTAAAPRIPAASAASVPAPGRSASPKPSTRARPAWASHKGRSSSTTSSTARRGRAPASVAGCSARMSRRGSRAAAELHLLQRVDRRRRRRRQ